MLHFPLIFRFSLRLSYAHHHTLTDTVSSSSKHVTDPPDAQKNFLIVDAKTQDTEIEEAFESFTKNRKDIAILLLNQHVGLAVLSFTLLNNGRSD